MASSSVLRRGPNRSWSDRNPQVACEHGAGRVKKHARGGEHDGSPLRGWQTAGRAVLRRG